MRLEELGRIADDPAAFITYEADAFGEQPPLRLQDGSYVDATYQAIAAGCGTASFPAVSACVGSPIRRSYRHGVSAISATAWCRGSSVAVMRPKRCASFLPDAKALGLPYVYLTTTTENVASQRVIETNGGVLLNHFTMDRAHGGR